MERINVFGGIFGSWVFIGVMASTVIFQIIIVEFLGTFAETVPLSWNLWGASIIIGALSLPIAMVIKCIPVSNPKATCRFHDGYEPLPTGPELAWLDKGIAKLHFIYLFIWLNCLQHIYIYIYIYQVSSTSSSFFFFLFNSVFVSTLLHLLLCSMMCSQMSQCCFFVLLYIIIINLLVFGGYVFIISIIELS